MTRWLLALLGAALLVAPVFAQDDSEEEEESEAAPVAGSAPHVPSPVPVEPAVRARRNGDAIEFLVKAEAPGIATIDLDPPGRDPQKERPERKADRRRLGVAAGVNRLAVPLPKALRASAVMWEVAVSGKTYGDAQRIGSLGRGEEQFTHPLSVALGSAGRIYVADAGNDRIEVLSDRHTFLFEFGGLALNVGQLPVNEQQRFDEPADLVQSINKDVYVVDRNNGRVVRLDRDGRFLGSFGREASVAAMTMGLKFPRGIASNSRGEILVADTGNDRVVVFDRDGRFQRVFGAFGRGPRQFKTPFDVAVDDANGLLIADTNNDRIQIFDNFGKLEVILQGGFAHPLAVRADPDGTVWAVDGRAKQVVRLARDGRVLTRLAAPELPFEEPTDVAVTPAGDLYVVDRAASALWFVKARPVDQRSHGMLPRP